MSRNSPITTAFSLNCATDFEAQDQSATYPTFRVTHVESNQLGSGSTRSPLEASTPEGFWHSQPIVSGEAERDKGPEGGSRGDPAGHAWRPGVRVGACRS
jgi:hypothetical protein